MPTSIADLYKEFYNNMSHEEWNVKYREVYLKELQNTPTACWGPQMSPPSGLLTADRSPMTELKKSDLTLWEHCKYWWYSRKVRRAFIKDRREERKHDIRMLAHRNFHKWKEYADRVPPKK